MPEQEQSSEIDKVLSVVGGHAEAALADLAEADAPPRAGGVLRAAGRWTVLRGRAPGHGQPQRGDPGPEEYGAAPALARNRFRSLRSTMSAGVNPAQASRTRTSSGCSGAVGPKALREGECVAGRGGRFRGHLPFLG
jgi:hypothetical protein